MASIADAYVRIRPDTTGLDADGISKPASEMGKKAGESAGKAFGLSFSTLVKGAAVAAAGVATGQIAAFFKDTITAASDVAESTSKIKVVFGQAANEVLKFGKTSATSMGISQASYREAVGTLGNLFVALKLPGPQAVKMSTDMVKLAGDLASFNNTKPEEALEALRSALIGETEPMQRYGVNINAATLQTQAFKMGLIDNVKDALTPAQKATATYALVMDQTKTAQGDFARTSDGLANSTRIAAAQWADLKAKLGDQFLPIATKVFQWIKDTALPALDGFVQGLKGVSSNVGGFAGDMNTLALGVSGFFGALKNGDVTSDGFVGNMEKIGAAVRDFGGWINQNKDWIGVFVGTLVAAKLAVDGYTASVRVVTTVTELWAKAQAILNGTLLVNPIGLIVVVIAGFIAAWVAAYNRVEWFHNAVNFWFGNIYKLALMLYNEGIKPAFEGVVNAVQAALPYVKQFWDMCVSAFNGAVGAVRDFWQMVQPVLQSFWGFITGTVIPVVQRFWDFAKQAFDAIASIVSSWWNGAIKPILEVFWNYLEFTVGNTIKNFWNLMKLAWASISIIVENAWKVIKAVWDVFEAYVRNVLAPVFTWLWHNIIEPAWNGISSLISTVWNSAIKPVFEALGGFIRNTVVPAFEQGVKLIGNAWKQIEELAKAPVNFVINTVINRGIIDSLNTVTGWLGHNANLGHLSALADGGMVRGPGTGRSDSILGLSAGGMPTARVSNGEYVVNARATSRNLALLQAINGGAPGYADGGLIGTLVGALTDPVGTILKAVKAATPIDDIARNFSGNKIAEGIVGMPEKIFDAVTAWVKDKLSFFSGGGVNLGGPSGSSIGAILALAQSFYPGAAVSSGYRPGDPGWHGTGLAADIIGGGPAGMAQIAAGFYSISGRLLELIHSGGGGFFVKNGQRVGADYYASEIAGHYDHVHVAANANALGFANGGVIPEPIWGVGKSGRRYTFGERGPETVTPGIGGPGGFQFTVNVQGDVSEAHVAQIKNHVDSAFNKFYVQLKTGRRR